MGSPTSDAINWWAAAHILAILGQLALCVVGTVSFVFTRPNNYNGHIPSDDEFWDDVDHRTVIPWVSAAVGAATTFFNIVLFIALWKTYGPDRQRRLMRSIGPFRNTVLIGSSVLSLVLVADIALAVKSGLAHRNSICATASIASVFITLTICMDLLRLRNLYKDKKKDTYIIELGQFSGDDMSGPIGAPPPYEAVAGSR
ncbi:uncharacterized protein GGS22DRAFT_186094 [Annulohypoxylon maeteangense]|uniref:uncharacterized protein n=1 Tax=Annulohypoxylon maeteangense TaxID=1927788 RepID=UPI0020081077|nr:uncharacterized protein GGS22DRAFT_186094 [Annulohypoxylon maeteangense]KAI0887261.1 hypothetical protein GGS22DRAFT_186094 [Annulohypoxylon maeteangense]